MHLSQVIGIVHQPESNHLQYNEIYSHRNELQAENQYLLFPRESLWFLAGSGFINCWVLSPHQINEIHVSERESALECRCECVALKHSHNVSSPAELIFLPHSLLIRNKSLCLNLRAPASLRHPIKLTTWHAYEPQKHTHTHTQLMTSISFSWKGS